MLGVEGSLWILGFVAPLRRHPLSRAPKSAGRKSIQNWAPSDPPGSVPVLYKFPAPSGPEIIQNWAPSEPPGSELYEFPAPSGPEIYTELGPGSPSGQPSPSTVLVFIVLGGFIPLYSFCVGFYRALIGP